MRYTNIVTSFLKNKEQILILKRSQNVKSMKGLWGGVSGVIENNENPLQRAKIEIFEEVGITEDDINLLKSKEELKELQMIQQQMAPMMQNPQMMQQNPQAMQMQQRVQQLTSIMEARKGVLIAEMTADYAKEEDKISAEVGGDPLLKLK